MGSGGEFYDRPQVLERYRGLRDESTSDPVATMLEPALSAVLGDVRGLRLADLGCGGGERARRLLDAGAASCFGVDASQRMVHDARCMLRDRPGATVEHRRIEDFAPQPGAFDCILSVLALHYVADLGRVVTACAHGLAEDGRLVVAVVHPVITSHDARAHEEELRTSWVVDDYFDRGPRRRQWLGSTVTWHHRTVADHVEAIARAGLTLTGLHEPEPQPQAFAGGDGELARRRRIPLFLLVTATRSRGR